MKNTSSSPTMKDVAREAGVALGTVSKVVNGIPVGEKYRKKVEAAIEKLNYQVNSYAQGLKSNRTYTVALLIPNTANPFFSDVIYHINTALQKRKYKMLLCCTDFDPTAEQEYISMAEQNRVDGIIGLTYNPDLEVRDNVPCVTIDRYIGQGIPCIASDNFQGGQMAARKLWELGCQKVALLQVGSLLNTEPNKRTDGFLNICKEKGMNCAHKFLQDFEPFSLFEDFLLEFYHDGKLDLDGIFCVTDELAGLTRDFLHRLGIRVPEDVQLIGFDGLKRYPSDEYLCSTIVQPTEALAETCVDILLSDSAYKPALVCLPVTYARGGTTREDQ